MALVTHKFKLDLTPGAARQVLYTSQGDIGRPFEADLYWNGSPWTATGTTASIRGKKPDDTVFDYTATVSGTAVTFETTEQMTIISGPVECELVFSQGGDVVASANFVLMVEDSPYNPDAPSESVIPGIVDLIEDTIGGDVRDEVDALIAAHPELILMLQDNSVTTPKIAEGAVTEGKIASNAVTTGKLATGAVTSAKVDADFLKTIENAYVTPEMFGAVGDGETDDTAAWQAAVNVGVPVIAKSSIYKCGQINVTKNISVDLNGADFICISDRLFDCRGEVVATLTGEADYTANTGYTITSANYSNYTGFAMLKGTNNFEKARTYYRGGFVCEFYNGSMCGSYPVDATDVTIEIINPITVHFYNCGEFIRENPTGKAHRNISVLYGFGSTIRSAKAKNSTGYIVYAFEASLNCHVSNAKVEHNYETSDNNSYIVAFLDSSFCSVTCSHLYNEKWHSVTTGGNYLCYRNKISDGAYLSGTNYGVLDHDNALGTLVENADISGGCGVAGRGVVKNINILPNDANMCFLQLRPSSNINNAIYYAENIHLKETRVTPSYTAVRFQISPQTTGNTYYVKTATLRNIFQTETANGNIEASVVNGSTIDLREVIVDNTNMNIFVCKTGGNNVDVSNSKLFIQNVNQPSANTRPALGANGYEFNYVSVTNSFLKNLMGTYADVLLCNVNFQGRPSSTNTTITGSLTGNNVLAKIENSVLVQPNRVSIANMWYANTDVILFNITKDNEGNVFGFRVLNGTWTKIAIT